MEIKGTAKPLMANLDISLNYSTKLNNICQIIAYTVQVKKKGFVATGMYILYINGKSTFKLLV